MKLEKTIEKNSFKCDKYSSQSSTPIICNDKPELRYKKKSVSLEENINDSEIDPDIESS